jgi:hypothetical protein
MKRCKILRHFFDSKPRVAGKIEEFTDAEANRHALAGRVKIMKPKKKKAKAKKKTAVKKPAISSSKESAGALAKPKPKKKSQKVEPKRKIRKNEEGTMVFYYPDSA